MLACDDTGLPDFYALHFQSHDRDLCVWAFDFLHHNGRELRELPLFERKSLLKKVVLTTRQSTAGAMLLIQHSSTETPGQFSKFGGN
jgi:ATP-dependent DNA ligase